MPRQCHHGQGNGAAGQHLPIRHRNVYPKGIVGGFVVCHAIAKCRLPVQLQHGGSGGGLFKDLPGVFGGNHLHTGEVLCNGSRPQCVVIMGVGQKNAVKASAVQCVFDLCGDLIAGKAKAGII